MSGKRIFAVFLLLNIFNYVDRQVLPGIAPLIQTRFGASDAMIGALGTAFMLTYALTAIPFGAWSDRWKPHKVAAVGAVIWSLATLSSVLAWSVTALFVLRAMVGVGEAAFVSTGSTILSMTFRPEKRSRVLGWFNLGMPIGGAVGVVAGGAIGMHFGWQWAFATVGIPGVILAFFTWRLHVGPQALDTPPENQPRFDWRRVRTLLKNPAYIYTCLGYAGISYAFGAIVTFAPLYFHRDYGYSVAQAALLTGVIQVMTGLLGAPIGGYIADAWVKRNPRGRAYTVMLAMSLSAVCLFFGIVGHSIPLLLLSTFFVLWHVGVASAITFDVTDRRIWNTAQGLSLLVMHGLGDVPSNYVTGMISDHTNLTFSMSLLPIPMLFAAVCFYLVSVRITRASVPPLVRLPNA